MLRPAFGNTWKLVKNTRTHRTMHGLLRQLQGDAPMWEGFTVTFIAMKESEIDDFKAWVIASAGEIVAITDFENRDWTGIIVSPNIKIKKYRESINPATHAVESCQYEVSFDFESNPFTQESFVEVGGIGGFVFGAEVIG